MDYQVTWVVNMILFVIVKNKFCIFCNFFFFHKALLMVVSKEQFVAIKYNINWVLFHSALLSKLIFQICPFGVQVSMFEP